MDNFTKNEKEHQIRNSLQAEEKKTESLKSNLKKSALDYTKKGQDYINQNPNKSVAISAFTGAVVGSLFTIFNRKQK